jgi:hypothetical protein
MIVKTLELRKNLKELLDTSQKEDLFLDYYGDLYKIVPVRQNKQQITQAQKIIDKYSKLNARPSKDSIFSEKDPAKEKENFRNLRYNVND